MRDSLLWPGLRAFFIAFFSMVGICLGVIPVIMILSYLISSEEMEPDQKYDVNIEANADGVRQYLSSDTPVILAIDVRGIIGLTDLTQERFRQQLIESRETVLKDNRVKGILLEIESPGGTVVDADGIYRALKHYKEKYNVPVYAYVDGLCASGGMYVASAADKIYASDVSLIGSVGVISPSFLNFSQLIDKVGVQALTLYAGKGKDELNPLRPWKPDEQKPMEALIQYYYDMFVNIVTENRPQMNKEKLVADYGAHVFPAPEAYSYGFIDGVGASREQVLNTLVKDLGLHDYQVMKLGSNVWYDLFFNSQNSLFSGKIKHEVQLTPTANSELMGKFLYMYQGAN